MSVRSWVFVAFAILFSTGFSSFGEMPVIKHSVFLAGNTFTSENRDSLTVFFNRLLDVGQPYSVLFLGDFSKTSEKPGKDGKIIPEVNIFPEETGTGASFFVMGPNEWLSGAKEGKENTKSVIKSLKEKYQGKEIFTTDWGCPGPEEIPVSDDLTLILIDTEWWLHPFDTRFGKCGIENVRDVFIWLQDVLRRNSDKKVIVAGHHPIKSYGPHGGYLPEATSIAGFPYAIYKKYIGGREDIAHPEYKQLSGQLRILLNQFPNVIYASAHENSLQYFKDGNIHQIISGSLAKQSYADKKKPEFASEEAGIARLDFMDNGDVVLRFFTLNNGTETPAFSKTLFNKVPIPDSLQLQNREELFLDKTRIACASNQYKAGKFREVLMGKNYRDVWSTPVEAPVFNIAGEKGGLKIIQRGGGQQTHSIRMENSEGQQYVLRSVEKFAEGALPNEMGKTFIKDIVQDQISASNPYGLLPVAGLAEVAGVFHTNPEIVYVPGDPLLEQYRQDMADGLFIFEERPTGDCSSIASFGNSKNVVGTDDVLEKITEDDKHRVDQKAVLRIRLFDTFINDWDRHDDQWRWASFKEGGYTVYRPIPRDRDQAFFVNQGLLSRFAAWSGLMIKIQDFRPKTANIKGLAFNARHFDRTFLNQMDWNAWSATADTLTHRITDTKIREAVSLFPKEIRPLCADSIQKILIARKGYLKEMSRELYLFLSRKVNIAGTAGSDLFEISRLNDNETEVNVWGLNSKGEKKREIFNRRFITSETKEIDCYGLDGEDLFQIKGIVKKGPVVRIIGGQDKDLVADSSKVAGARKHNIVYDLRKSTGVKSLGETRQVLSKYKIIHDYDRKSFKYNSVLPALSFGYTPDDGLFAGGGASFNTQRFRRDNTGRLVANYAALTSAFNIGYTLRSLSATNGFDFISGININAPKPANNFFGFGNETRWEVAKKDKVYYQYRQFFYEISGGIQKRFGETAQKNYKEEATESRPVKEHRVGLEFAYQASDIENHEGRYINNYSENGLSPEKLKGQHYLFLNLGYSYQDIDEEFMPSRGIGLQGNYRHYFRLAGENPGFDRLDGEFTSYLSFRKNPRTTWALRIGGQKNFGQYAFFEAASLGGKTNLRGFRANRFSGDACAYYNAEARFKFVDFKNYLVNGEMGFLAFNDLGRVWLDGEDSKKWHYGFGGGIWVSPFKMAILTATLNGSKEDCILQVHFNYMF